MKVTKLILEENNRMITPIRIGINEGRIYVRFDFWWIGFRITRK